MISAIVFSKDRAMQLDALLRSEQKFCGDLFEEIIVLYTTSSPELEDGYIKLQETWPSVRLVKESSFKSDVHRIIDEAKNDLICMLCDDVVFYREVGVYKEQIHRTIERDDVFTVILSIGGDSIYGSPAYRRHRMPQFQMDGDLLTWAWRKGANEFRCPFMFAGNIYKRSEYIPFLNQIEFANPSTFEMALQQTFQRGPEHVQVKGLCACVPSQTLVHTLNNRVQDVVQNRSGQFYPQSPEHLNLLYLSGNIVDLDALDFSDVQGLHKETELKFTKA